MVSGGNKETPGEDGPATLPGANWDTGPPGPEFARNWPEADIGTSTSTNTAATQMVGRKPRFQPVPFMTGTLWCEIAANSSHGVVAGALSARPSVVALRSHERPPCPIP